MCGCAVRSKGPELMSLLPTWEPARERCRGSQTPTPTLLVSQFSTWGGEKSWWKVVTMVMAWMGDAADAYPSK